MVTKERAMDFKTIDKVVRPDNQRRITLPDNLVQEGVLFRMSYNSIGQILLEPQVPIPASEAWLFKNPEALASVRRGIADAAAGRISKVDMDTL